MSLYEKNKDFLLSDECNPKTPLAATFAKNMRLFMVEQDDFTHEDRVKYHKKIQSDIDRVKLEPNQDNKKLTNKEQT